MLTIPLEKEKLPFGLNVIVTRIKTLGEACLREQRPVHKPKLGKEGTNILASVALAR